jgi:hypothetical protein
MAYEVSQNEGQLHHGMQGTKREVRIVKSTSILGLIISRPDLFSLLQSTISANGLGKFE